MKIRKLRLISLIFAMSLFLTGCGPDPLYEMTEAEKELIVHGAAKVLAKHNIKQTDGINSIKPTADDLVEVVEDTESADDLVNQIDLNEPGIEGLITIQEAMGQPKLDLTYNGMRIEDIYQDGYSMVYPEEGYKYVVLSYNLRNPYIDTISVDAFSVGPVFYANFGDGNYIKNENTALLTYTVPSYRGNLTAGESVELVIVFPVEESFDETNTVRTMKVEVGGKKYYIDM